MKNIFIAICLFLALCVAVSAHTNDRCYDVRINEVIIKDSVFMNKINAFVSNDSIEELIRSNFIRNFSFENILKERPYIYVNIDARKTCAYKYRVKDDSIYNDLVVDKLKDVINNDSLTHILLSFRKNRTNHDYQTNYNGQTYCFDELEKLNGRRIFIKTGKSFSIKCDLSLDLGYYIPIIYYDGQLYLEPDLLQWFLIEE